MIFKINLILILLSSSWAFTISGFVRDSSTNKPIQNANIYVKSLDQGSSSSIDGFFKIDINSNGEIILEISHIGYKDKIIRIDNHSQEKLNITLEEIQSIFLKGKI